MTKSERREKLEQAKDLGIYDYDLVACTQDLCQAVRIVVDVILDMNKPTTARAKKALPKISPHVQMSKFTEWYELYPRHEAREAAISAWAKIEEVDYSLIIGKIQAQLRAGHFDKATKMIPMPASWLNGKRWLDEVESAKKKKRVMTCDRCPAEAVIEYHNKIYCRPCFVKERGY